jgi:hypothetical protein
MYWRGPDPTGHADSYYSLAAVLVFAWLRGAIGVYDAGLAAYALLAAAVGLIAVAGFRHPA